MLDAGTGSSAAVSVADFLAAIGPWLIGEGPLPVRLARSVRAAIHRGELPPPARLPAERTLARATGVGRRTVVAAYSLLREEGLVERRRGSGTWVRTKRPPPGRLPRGGLPPTTALTAGEATLDLSSTVLPRLDLVSDVVARTAKRFPKALLDETSSPFGEPELRARIAELLSRTGAPTTPDDVLVTTGGRQAVSLVSLALLGPGETALVEGPSRMETVDAFALAGAQVVDAALDGGRSAFLRAVARAQPELVYVMPSYHDPTGAVLSETARRQLARRALEEGLPVVEDNSLEGLALDGPPPAPIWAFAPGAPVVSIGSLNELFWSGLGIGWIRAPAPLIERLGRCKLAVDGPTARLDQLVALALLERVEEAQAERRAQLEGRLALLTELLGRFLPDWSWQRPAGGCSLWVQLPDGDARELAQDALRAGVFVDAGAYTSSGGSCRGLRLALASDPDSLVSGVRRLAHAWSAYAARRRRAQLRDSVRTARSGIALA